MVEFFGNLYRNKIETLISMPEKIDLKSILNISDPTKYKLHLASFNGKDYPLNVFVEDKEKWHSWNSWRSTKDEFNREYIFSLIDDHHEPDTWLFGGVYRVIERGGEDHAHSYKVELTNQFSPMIGRLKLKWKRSGRAKSRILENYIEQFEVSEILKEPYSGERFCGYENIDHDFDRLEAIFANSKLDWKAALENVKGVYLIIDKSNGKKYVGSAYGDTGIWSRWSTYMATGHGYNDELTKVIDEQGLDYARENFKFSLLEYRPMKTDDKKIFDREVYWKNALLSRGEFGYNKN